MCNLKSLNSMSLNFFQVVNIKASIHVSYFLSPNVKVEVVVVVVVVVVVLIIINHLIADVVQCARKVILCYTCRFLKNKNPT